MEDGADGSASEGDWLGFSLAGIVNKNKCICLTADFFDWGVVRGLRNLMDLGFQCCSASFHDSIPCFQDHSACKFCRAIGA